MTTDDGSDVEVHWIRNLGEFPVSARDIAFTSRRHHVLALF